MDRPNKEDLRVALHMVDDSNFLVGQWLKAEVLAQRDEVELAKNLRDKALAQIEAIRALLTTGPSQHGRGWRHDDMDEDARVAHGAEIADAQWEAAIRKALGE